MSLTLQHPELERLAKEVAERTGKSLEQAILAALQEKLLRLTPLSERLSVAAEHLKEDYEGDVDLTTFTDLERREIDRQFEAMANDDSYQELNRRLAEGFMEQD